MKKPKVQALIDKIRLMPPAEDAASIGLELAERVEAVLEVIGADPEAYEDAKTLAMAVRRALDGER